MTDSAPSISPRLPAPFAAAFRVPATGPPVGVDLLLDLDGVAEQARRAGGPAQTRHVLVGYDRVVVVHTEARADAPCVACVARHALDNYPYAEVDALWEEVQHHGFRATYDPDALGLVPHLLAECPPGAARVWIPGVPEVLVGAVYRHPRCQTPWHPPVGASSGALRLSSRVLNESLRGGTPDVDGLLSPTGPIRREKMVHGQAGLVSCITESMRHRGSRVEICGGASRTPALAARSARCESVERYQVTYEPADSQTVRAPVDGALTMYRDRYPGEGAAHVIDPDRLFFSVRDETETGRYDAATPLRWTTATSVTRDVACLVPAQAVWMAPVSRRGAPHVRASTNGCALGTSVEEAALHAVLELAERDGFVTSWLLRRRCRAVNPASVEDATFQALSDRVAATHPAYALHYLDTTSDLGIPSIWLLALRADGALGPATLTTGGGGLSVADAMAGALRELAGQLRQADPQGGGPRHTESYIAQLEAAPMRVLDVGDHGAYYAGPGARTRLRSFCPPSGVVAAEEVQAAALFPALPPADAREILRAIAHRLGELGSELVLKDLTVTPFRERGLFCVRALAPDLFPVSFGHDSQRVAVTDRLQRLAEAYGVPVPHTMEDLNPDVHPFA